jgi:hypothetical protein
MDESIHSKLGSHCNEATYTVDKLVAQLYLIRTDLCCKGNLRAMRFAKSLQRQMPRLHKE